MYSPFNEDQAGRATRAVFPRELFAEDALDLVSRLEEPGVDQVACIVATSIHVELNAKASAKLTT